MKHRSFSLAACFLLLAVHARILLSESDKTNSAPTQINSVGIKDGSSTYNYSFWPSSPPEDCPLARSRDMLGVLFTGRHANYTGADTWYPSWASDGNMYSPFTDGTVGTTLSWSAPGPQEPGKWRSGEEACTGNAKIVGDDPLNLEILALGTCPSPVPSGCRYPCGTLVHDGIWYYSTYVDPFGNLGPIIGFRHSKDYGVTWTETERTPNDPLFEKRGGVVKMGTPHFVDFGKNMEHSPDGKAYLVAHGGMQNAPSSRDRDNNVTWVTGDQIYLARVAPSIENMNDSSKYEFFAGHDDNNDPVWSPDFNLIKPLIDWNNRCGCATITYNAPLKRYMMCVTDGWRPEGKNPFRTWIAEADSITGPWRMVSFMDKFGDKAYFVNIPSKFVGADGRTMWLCYSSGHDKKENPKGSKYAMSLHEFIVTDPETQKQAESEWLEMQKQLAEEEEEKEFQSLINQNAPSKNK